MRKDLIQRFVLPVVVLFTIFLNVSVARAIPVVSVSPSATSVNLGDSFSLDIGISDVTDLFAYQFELSFDPTLLAATSLSEGVFLPTGGFTFFIPGAIDNTLGSVGLTLDTLFFAPTGVTGSGTLASLTFDALLLGGTSTVSLSNVILLDSLGAAITSSTQNGIVNVGSSTPVPEPSTIVLLGIGLVGIGIVRMRKTA